MSSNIQKKTQRGNQKNKKNTNRLIKDNLLYYRQNRIFDDIKGHLICLNKILSFPFLTNKVYYYIYNEDYKSIVDELIDILKDFGYTKIIFDSETKLMQFDLSEQTSVDNKIIRYHKYYGYITSQPVMLRLREHKVSQVDENHHLKCIKKILKSLTLKENRAYYFIDNIEMKTFLTQKLEKFEYNISTENVKEGYILIISF